MNLAVGGGQELKGTYWIWEARSLYTHLVLCLPVIFPGSRVQSQKSENKVISQLELSLLLSSGLCVRGRS